MTVTRRHALTSLGIAGTVFLFGRPTFASTTEAQAPAAGGPFTLPPLPYAAAALEPHIDAETMTIHHDRHHQGYVTNLNAAVARAGLGEDVVLDDLLRALDKVPAAERTAIRNNGGGHANHVQFWSLLSPKGGGTPTGAIADALRSTFGSVASFQERLNAAAMGRFGSGWAWLSEENGTLVVHSTANQDSPLMEGKRPIFGVDVWEHAYYLKYQNRRADYLAAIWNVIDWNDVNRRLRA